MLSTECIVNSVESFNSHQDYMVCMGYSGLLVTMHHTSSQNAGSTTVPLLLAILGTLRLGSETRPANMRIVNVMQATKILFGSEF